MNRSLVRLAAALVIFAAALAPLPSSAIRSFAFVTFNRSDHRAWITIQNFTKTANLDSGWVEAHGQRRWLAGRYTDGAYYFVRFEFVKAGTLDHVLCDTKGRTFAEYRDSSQRSDVWVEGLYEKGKCWIKADDQVFPY